LKCITAANSIRYHWNHLLNCSKRSSL